MVQLDAQLSRRRSRTLAEKQRNTKLRDRASRILLYFRHGFAAGNVTPEDVRWLVGAPVCSAGHLGRVVAPLPQLSGQVFFLGRTRDWPPFESDCLYAETEPFGLSAFGFLASLLLPLGCPFAIASFLCRFHFGAGFEIVPRSSEGHYKNLGRVGDQSEETPRI
jgi:hypothetical protein